jgi:hypothetical protein
VRQKDRICMVAPVSRGMAQTNFSLEADALARVDCS